MAILLLIRNNHGFVPSTFFKVLHFPRVELTLFNAVNRVVASGGAIG